MPTNKEDLKDLTKLGQKIVAVVIFLAALFGVLEYFGVNPFNKKEVVPPSQVSNYTQNANTNNGTMIQAEKVEFSEKRIFSEDQGRNIEKRLLQISTDAKTRKIIIFVNMGNLSSLKFADNLKEFLINKGWGMIIINSANISSWPFFEEFPGIGVYELPPPTNDKIGIFIS